MSTITFTRTPSPEQLAAAQTERDRSVYSAQESLASFDRCDTDGALSQWGHDKMSDVRRLQAQLYENGEIAEFEALFDTEGNLVPAERFSGTYGMGWRLLEPKEGQKKFFNPSADSNDARRITKDAAKGFYVGTIAAPARAELVGAGLLGTYAGIRPKTYGFNPDVEIVDNGQ